MAPKIYNILGSVKNREATSDGGQWMTIQSAGSGESYTFFYPDSDPIRKHDVIGGKSIRNDQGQFMFVAAPAVEPSTTKRAVKEALKNSLFTKAACRKVDSVYTFYKDTYSPADSPESNARDESSRVLESVAAAAFCHKQHDPSPVSSLVALGLREKTAEMFLENWRANVCMRRLLLLGLTPKDVEACCSLGWPSASAVSSWEISESRLYHQLKRNPYVVIALPLAIADSIANRYQLRLHADMRSAGECARYVYTTTRDRGWASHPTRPLTIRYPNFHSVSRLLCNEFGCSIRYNCLYLHHHNQVEDTLAELLVDTTPLSSEPFDTISTRGLCDEQVAAAAFTLENPVSVITGAAGTGKCLDPDTRVRHHDGHVTAAKDVRRGDTLMGDNGHPRVVMSTTSGTDDMFEIRPSRGDPFVCNAPHVLTLQDDKKKVYDIPLEKYANTQDTGYLFTRGVEYAATSVLVDPWLVGAWMARGIPGTNEIACDQTDRLDRAVRRYKCTVVCDNGVARIRSLIARKVNVLVLLLNSFGHHVPNDYMVNSCDVRSQLLEGLMGTQMASTPVTATLPSKVAVQARNVARSLGYAASADGCRVRVGASMYGSNDSMDTRDTFSITPIGKGEYAGFQLSGNGRFLLEDYTVTHNTTVLKSVVKEIELRGMSYHVATFTGKAVSHVKRVLSTADRRVTTIHRVIRMHDPPSPNVLIIDEVSMVPNRLMAQLLVRTGNPQVVMFGDPNQLQPIQWGDLTNQLLQSVPRMHLEIDHRHDGDSVLHDNTRSLSTDSGTRQFKWGKDCTFIQGQCDALHDLLLDLAEDDPLGTNVTIVSPYKNVQDVNDICATVFLADPDKVRDALAALGATSPTTWAMHDDFGIEWRVGMRVMMTTHNFYDDNVMNGDEGTVVGLVANKHVTVSFQNGTTIDIPSTRVRDDMNGTGISTLFLVPSWAMTIHKSQGSEWDTVIFFLRTRQGYGSFYNRNLLYTGVSRAKRRLFVVADSRNVFSQAVNVDPPRRVDNLSKRLADA